MIFEHIHFNGLINTSFLNYFIEGFLSETSSSRALAPDCPLYLLSISVSDCLIFRIDSLNFIRFHTILPDDLSNVSACSMSSVVRVRETRGATRDLCQHKTINLLIIWVGWN